MCNVIKTAGRLIFLFSFFIILSCATTAGNKAVSFSSSESSTVKKARVMKIKKPYSQITLRKSLVQFHELINSFDYFNQFTWGDYIFEDYLTIIYGLDSSVYRTGDGCVISVYDSNGQVRETIGRSVIETNGKGEIWWQTEHTREGEEPVFYEVLTNRFSVPVTVRFRNSETGEAFSRDTMFGESVLDAMLSMSDKEIQEKLDEERDEYAVQKLMPVYENIKNIGVEVVEAGGKKIEAVHYQGEIPDNGGTGTLDVWYTPELPHGIVRIIMNRTTVAEITEWISGAERKITEDSPHELPAYSTGGGSADIPESGSAYSEGTPGDPVKLSVDEVWEGSVEAEGVSYYFFEVPEQGDVKCTVRDFTGLAELYYYGNDYSYKDWTTGSEGGELDFQEYAARKGDLLYFTVNDISDSYSEGEKYYIDIQVDPLLDPLGVRMLNNYSSNPEVLDEGKNRIKISGSDISYFVFVMKEAGNIELIVDNYENEDERFEFIDVDKGSYSSSGYVDKSESRLINITGLEKGASLYFYHVRKDGLKNKKINITVK